MSVVYRAHDVTLDRTVAVNVMLNHLARQPEFRQRFLREVKVLAKLEPPSIPSAALQVKDRMFLACSTAKAEVRCEFNWPDSERIATSPYQKVPV
jgi:serine/threonine protein kinase